MRSLDRRSAFVGSIQSQVNKQTLALSQTLGRMGRPPGQIRGMLHPGA
jgi:hypothetical protein